jgi:arylsulfatase A-like enzyme
MIWRWGRRFEAGHVAQQIVEAVDVPTTLCRLAGLPAMATSDGKDISALLQGGHQEIHRMGVTEFAWSRSIRMGDYRLVLYPPEMFSREYPQGFGELYDIANDPWEMENLYFQPEQRERIAGMRSEYLDWLITTTRPKTILPLVSGHNEQMSVRWQCATWPDGKIAPDDVRDQMARNARYI